MNRAKLWLSGSRCGAKLGLVNACFRQTVGGITALSVLVCSLVCAYPSRGKAFSPDEIMQPAAKVHEDGSSCHGHSGREGDPHPLPGSAPCHDGSGDCTSCQDNAVLRADSQSGTDFSPQTAISPLPSIVLPARVLQTGKHPVVTETVPPPSARLVTLFEHHCALII